MNYSVETLLKDILQNTFIPGTDGLPVFEVVYADRIAIANKRLKMPSKVKKVSIDLPVAIPCGKWREKLAATVSEKLSQHDVKASVSFSMDIPRLQPANDQASLAEVKNIIAVASGKGGVGKSTTSVNLALALAAEGASVGILDADIYGPSQPKMLGVEAARPELLGDSLMRPVLAQGVQLISMGNLVTEKTPMVWRGPMVSGALKQLLNNTRWQSVDYLIVDMPPGTGDIQLTLSQSVPVTGSIVVTTPQDIALIDAKKGVEMFKKVSIPVLGVVENMATHICSSCGHADAIFGSDGGKQLAKEYGVSLLGQLPLKRSICEQTDKGQPPVAADENSAESKEYRKMATALAVRLWRLSKEATPAPQIAISDD